MSTQSAFFIFGVKALFFDQAPERPPRRLALLQAEARSSGAERFAHPAFADDDLIELYWPRMLKADKEALLAFWRDTTRGMAKTFTWRDHSGNEQTVRFAEAGLPEITQKTPDRFAVRVRLRVEP